MGWFRPKLEEGERVVLRLPMPERVPWLQVGFWLFFPLTFIAGAYLARGFDLDDPQDWLLAQFFAGVGILSALVALIPPLLSRYRWRVLVTDRRVLAVTGRLPRRHAALDRNAITAVARDTVNQSLLFDLDGRQVSVRFPSHWEENMVLDAIGREAESIAP